MKPLMPLIGTSDNLFHDGNPATGVEGTIVTAEHLNNEQDIIRDTQSELIAILTAASLAPASTAGQLLAAIQKLTLSRTDPGADIKADGAAAIAKFLANLGIKGGALLDVGSTAEVAAGTVNKLVNIPALTAFFDLSATALNGSIRIPDRPGGIIFAWGAVPAGSGGTFTRAFTSSPFVIALPNSSVGGGISADTFYVNSTSPTGFTTIDQALPRKYIAIGK